MKKWNTNWASPLKVLLSGLSIGTLALLMPVTVSAVAPPANSSIGNIATASYTDASGKPQTVQSNQVSTIVAQTGSLALTNDNTKSTAVGNTVYMPHTLTNLGNGTDTFTITVTDNVAPNAFSSIAVYPDASGTGVPSSTTPLCSSAGPTLCTAGFTQLLTANGNFNFVVAYQVPGTASTPATPFDTASVKAVPATGTGIPYSPASVSRLDTVNLTTGAAFSATKALATPAVSPPSNAWPPVVTSGKASAASCPTAWPVADSTSPLCTYTVYTISYQNNGAAVGAFSVKDVIPSGMTYVTGSAVWSGNGGVAMADGSTLAQTGSGSNVIKSSYDSTGKVFEAVVPIVNPNVSGTISFVVLINSSAAVGQSTTTNIADFFSTSCDLSQTISTSNCGGTTTPGSHTNPSPFPITQTYGVVAANVASTTPDTAAPPPQSGIDLVVQPTVSPGGSVSFTDYIVNTGNGFDTFNLTIPIANSSFPVGTSFQFFRADGVTPLLDSNGDGIPDTGPVVPGVGNAVAVVVKATIPASTAIGTGPFYALTTATSVGNGAAIPTVLDSVWNEVQRVVAAVVKVDLTNTADGNRTIVNGVVGAANSCTAGVDCDLGTGPSSGPTDKESTTPGTGVLFPLFVKNNDASSTSYNLTAPGLPVGWTVKFVAQGGTCASPAITQPVTVASGAQTEVMACVTPPTGTPVGTTNVFIKVTSASDPGVTDTITDAVVVNPPVLRSITLTPGTSSNTIDAGGTVVQPATLGNSGNQNCGVTNGFNVTATLDATSAAAGWTAVVYYDKAPLTTIGSEDTQLGAPTVSGAGNLSSSVASGFIPLVPGANIPLLVKFFAPSNAVNGYVATATLTVADRNPVVAEQCPSQSSQFTMKVSSGLLRVQKLQANDPTCTGGIGFADSAFTVSQLNVHPGECLVYRIVATNEGSGPVTSVVINDTAAAFTTYQSTAGASTCVITNGTGTATFGTTPGLSCSGGAAPGVTLNANGTMTMQFPVKVQN